MNRKRQEITAELDRARSFLKTCKPHERGVVEPKVRELEIELLNTSATSAANPFVNDAGVDYLKNIFSINTKQTF